MAAGLRDRRTAGRHRDVRTQAGSDLKQVRATARRDGDHYVLNGTKTFISNGLLANLILVVARTEPEAGHRGMSLLVVEEGFEGFERGRKIGNRA